ncbi:MAG: tetratricopeptide repeat protein, partial [Aequorivita sp.]|nr:tetratricopeptide repeat protein [Aequorivita sp.]
MGFVFFLYFRNIYDQPMKDYLCVFLLLVVCASNLFSQSGPKQIDSLMQLADSSNDSIKLRIYNKVSFHYIFNDPERAKNLLQKGIAISKNKNIPFSEAELVNTYGIYYDVSGKADSAKYYFEKALEISEKNNFKIITVMIINNLGMFHWNKGNYQQALDYFFQALEMNKTNTNDSKNGVYFNNIGLIYQEMGQYEKALEYHNQSLAVRKKYKEPSEISTSLANIGVVLGALGNYPEAENKFLEAINTAKAANELGKYYDALSGLSDIYLEQEQAEKAIPLLKELLEGRNKNNIDRRSSLGPISNIIKAYNHTNRPTLALQYVEKGNDFLKEFPDLKNAAVLFFQNASETYFRQNRPELGAAYLQKAIDAKEKIFSTENAQAIANLETKYNLAEKEKKLAETRANLAESELELEQKNIFIFGMAALVIFLGVLGFLVYRQQKLKNDQLQKESQLKTALAKIETQNQLQEQRLRISRDLHDNIGSQLTFIISSIDNLKFGLEGAANTVTDKLGKISEFASQTIYELRDTIWAMNKTDISVEDLQARISNFIEKAKVASNVDFQFKVEKDFGGEARFTSVQGMNIYRIIQEAVNNALKYSEATLITVDISKISSFGEEMPTEQRGIAFFNVEITDNGKGFDSAHAKFGNGIANIKKRANDL